MRYNKIKPDKSSIDFFIKKEYCDEFTVLNIYNDEGRIQASFIQLSALVRYITDEILDYWSIHQPDMLEKYKLQGVEYEEYIISKFKCFIHNNAIKFYGYKILLEYKQKYALDK